MATKTAKRNTKKAVKETKVDFSNSIEKIKETAKSVNTEVLTAATEVLEDIRTNGAQIRETAVNKVKEAVEKINLENGVQFVKDTAKNINDYSLETAEEIIEGAVKGSKEWQVVAEKAVKGGLELAEKQQDIVFDTLETLKGQLTTSSKRFRNLFRNN
jgi:hypothetical protein